MDRISRLVFAVAPKSPELAGPGVDPDGDWPIIDERHHHVGTEYASLHVDARRADELGKVIHELTRNRRLRRVRETWSATFADVPIERELRDCQEFGPAAGVVVEVEQGSVHLAGVIFKNSQRKHLVANIFDCLAGVVVTDADQGKQSLANCAGHVAIDHHGCGTNSLQKDPHRLRQECARLLPPWRRCPPRDRRSRDLRSSWL